MGQEIMLRFSLMSNKALWGIGVVIMAVVGYATMALVMHVEEVEVPKIQGLHPSQAQAMLENLRIVMKERDRRYHDKIPEGYIVEQEPSPAESIKRGSAVWIVVSKGSLMVSVPDLKDQLLRQAGLNLQKSGIILGRVARIYRSEPSDTIIAQTPDASTSIPRGSSVSVLVSEGVEPANYVMPDFVGTGSGRAKSWITGAGIMRKRINMVSREDAADGVVLDQSPEAGSIVRSEDTVALSVNTRSVQSRVQMRMSPILFDVPKGLALTRLVRIVLTDDEGRREIFKELREAGTQVKLSTRVVGDATIEIFMDTDTEPVETIQP